MAYRVGAIVRPAMVVVAVTVDADAQADAPNVNTDNGCIRGAAQQGERENRGDQSFHENCLSRGANLPPSPVAAWMALSLHL